MKSLWDFPSRTAAVEALGVEGFVAAAIREQGSLRGMSSFTLPQDEKRRPPLAERAERPSVDRGPAVAFA